MHIFFHLKKIEWGTTTNCSILVNYLKGYFTFWVFTKTFKHLPVKDGVEPEKG